MTYLVDTTWIIEYLRGNQEVIQHLRSLRDEGLSIAIVSLAELYEGVFRSNNPSSNEAALKDFLTGVTILSIDEEVCIIFGREMARLRQRGMSVGDMDLLIAATALRHNLTLLTQDQDFQRVENLDTIFLN
jgi:tRNA(fMet)-specific endonuclease VapC